MTTLGVAVRTTAVAIGATVLLNLAILAIGALAGAELEVAQSTGKEPQQIGPAIVAITSIGPLLLGGLVLWLVGRRGRRSWLAVGRLGLALGVVTVVMPVSAVATTGTTLTLAAMHVVTGLVWFVLVRTAQPRAQAAHPELDDASAPD